MHLQLLVCVLFWCWTQKRVPPRVITGTSVLPGPNVTAQPPPVPACNRPNWEVQPGGMRPPFLQMSMLLIGATASLSNGCYNGHSDCPEAIFHWIRHSLCWPMFPCMCQPLVGTSCCRIGLLGFQCWWPKVLAICSLQWGRLPVCDDLHLHFNLVGTDKGIWNQNCQSGKWCFVCFSESFLICWWYLYPRIPLCLLKQNTPSPGNVHVKMMSSRMTKWMGLSLMSTRHSQLTLSARHVRATAMSCTMESPNALTTRKYLIGQNKMYGFLILFSWYGPEILQALGESDKYNPPNVLTLDRCLKCSRPNPHSGAASAPEIHVHFKGLGNALNFGGSTLGNCDSAMMSSSGASSAPANLTIHGATILISLSSLC